MTEVATLLWPKWRSILATWREGERIDRLKIVFFGSVGLLFWVLIYYLVTIMLRHVLVEPVYGDFLMGKLLSFLSVIFFAVLVFSNLITSLTVFFFSKDLQIHLSAPVSPGGVFIARYIETALQSSWMVIFFGLPILVAYGRVFGAGWYYYPWMITSLVAFLLIPAAVGAALSMLLVKAFPARKMHDVLIVAGFALLVGMFMVIRLLRPEDLFNPDLFAGFAEYFTMLKTPDTYVAPAVWLSESILGVLRGRPTDGLYHFGLLLSNGLMAALVAQWLAGRIYPDAYSKSQEGRTARLTTSGLFNRSVQRLGDLFGPASGEIVKKDIRSFFRETSQWTQLLLLVGLVAIYLFNARAIPIWSVAPIEPYWINLGGMVLNLLVVGFLVSAVSVRFVLPMVSLEGLAIWIVWSAPVSTATLVLSKFLLAFVPLTIVSQTLVLLSTTFLGFDPMIVWISAGTAFFMTTSVTALAIGVGALYPDFREQNVAQLSTGASAIIFMIVSMFYIVAALATLLFGFRVPFRHIVSGVPLVADDWLRLSLMVLVLVGGSVFVCVDSLRRGARNLEQMPW